MHTKTPVPTPQLTISNVLAVVTCCLIVAGIIAAIIMALNEAKVRNAKPIAGPFSVTHFDYMGKRYIAFTAGNLMGIVEDTTSETTEE